MIETGRLILTEPSLADFDESYAMNSDAAVTEVIGGKPARREDAWNKLLRNIGHWKAFGFGIFTVREKKSRGYVGEVGGCRCCSRLDDANTSAGAHRLHHPP